MEKALAVGFIGLNEVVTADQLQEERGIKQMRSTSSLQAARPGKSASRQRVNHISDKMLH